MEREASLAGRSLSDAGVTQALDGGIPRSTLPSMVETNALEAPDTRYEDWQV